MSHGTWAYNSIKLFPGLLAGVLYIPRYIASRTHTKTGPRSSSQIMTLVSKSWNDEASPRSTQRNDNAALHRLGKRSQLRRNFGFMSMVGFSTTLMVCFPLSNHLLELRLTCNRQRGSLSEHYFKVVCSTEDPFHWSMDSFFASLEPLPQQLRCKYLRKPVLEHGYLLEYCPEHMSQRSHKQPEPLSP